MNFIELDISLVVIEYFAANHKHLHDLETSNGLLENECGIKTFFESSDQLNQFIAAISEKSNLVAEPNRREYGDFQTNFELSVKTSNYIKSISNTDSFDFILEPTCGKGNFIIAALSKFNGIKRIVGVEIYHPYIWETKFKILEFFLNNDNYSKPINKIKLQKTQRLGCDDRERQFRHWRIHFFNDAKILFVARRLFWIFSKKFCRQEFNL